MWNCRGMCGVGDRCGSGIGAATAQLFAREGAKGRGAEPHRQRGTATVARIQQSGGEAMPLITDVDEAGRLQCAIDELRGRWAP